MGATEKHQEGSSKERCIYMWIQIHVRSCVFTHITAFLAVKMQTVRPASWALKSRLSSPATLVNVLTPQNVDSSHDSKTMFTLRYSKASATAHDGMCWVVAAGDWASRVKEGGGRTAHQTSRNRKSSTNFCFFFRFLHFSKVCFSTPRRQMRESFCSSPDDGRRHWPTKEAVSKLKRWNYPWRWGSGIWNTDRSKVMQQTHDKLYGFNLTRTIVHHHHHYYY